jgi:hypothetical protein
MRQFTLSFIVAAMMSSVIVNAADLFTGTWIENRDQRKYDERPSIITYERYENGIKFSSGAGPVYAAKLDDKEYPLLSGAPATDKLRLKKIDDNTYETSVHRGERQISSERIQVSDGGKKLTRRVTSWDDEGKPTMNVLIYTRRRGADKGCASTWKVDVGPFANEVGRRTANRHDLFGPERLDIPIHRI